MIKNIIRRTPLLSIYRNISSSPKSKVQELNVFSGSYSSWEEATKHSTGYNLTSILEKVKSATLKVIKGEATFERDSVLFYKMEYNWPLIANFLRIAVANNNTLRVLDFGGSLGSVYFQNRKFLSVVDKMEWSVVEQKHYVTCGKQFIENDELKFYKNIDEAIGERQADVILLSSVIQYLEKPYALLEKIFEKKFKYIIIDRTCFLFDNSPDIITIQNVDPNIFAATIPTHILNFNKFLTIIGEKYIVKSVFDSCKIKYIDLNTDIIHKGLILSLKQYGE